MVVHFKQNDVSVADEAEREEGEIDNSDDGDDAIGFEYEAISSDEEFTLRQKIEALEARNLELEKIASISARSQDAYGNLNAIELSFKFSILIEKMKYF